MNGIEIVIKEEKKENLIELSIRRSANVTITQDLASKIIEDFCTYRKLNEKEISDDIKVNIKWGDSDNSSIIHRVYSFLYQNNKIKELDDYFTENLCLFYSLQLADIFDKGAYEITALHKLEKLLEIEKPLYEIGKKHEILSCLTDVIDKSYNIFDNGYLDEKFFLFEGDNYENLKITPEKSDIKEEDSLYYYLIKFMPSVAIINSCTKVIGARNDNEPNLIKLLIKGGTDISRLINRDPEITENMKKITPLEVILHNSQIKGKELERKWREKAEERIKNADYTAREIFGYAIKINDILEGVL